MALDFELILVILTLASAVVCLLDKFIFAPKRDKIIPPPKVPLWIDYSRSFFPIFLLVLVLRSFVFEPFRIPSGSLEPTLLVGDLIMVSKFSYGLRLPVINNKVIGTWEPKRGDIVVFRKPGEPGVHYIKRIVGLPGDTISYVDKVLFINGQEAKQAWVDDEYIKNQYRNSFMVKREEEDLTGVKHQIYRNPLVPAVDQTDITVPPGHYFAMGDNRDDSLDSRSWGFLPEKNLVGKAIFIWMSVDTDNWWRIRWHRIGSKIV